MEYCVLWVIVFYGLLFLFRGMLFFCGLSFVCVDHCRFVWMDYCLVLMILVLMEYCIFCGVVPVLTIYLSFACG